MRTLSNARHLALAGGGLAACLLSVTTATATAAPTAAAKVGKQLVALGSDTGWPAGSYTPSFGERLALSGTTLVEHSGAAGPAYVFAKGHHGWTQTAALDGPGGSGTEYGDSVAIAGNTAFVGDSLSPSTSGTGSFDSGRVYVFTKVHERWRRTQVLKASDASESAEFGETLAMSGTTAVIGAPGVNSNTGAAYVFAKVHNRWRQTAELTSSDGTLEGGFGESVAVSGSTAVVGAPADDATPRGGHAFVFVKTGKEWTQTTELSASGVGTSGGVAFGTDVAVGGSTILVDASAQDTFGRVYVFSKSVGQWKATQKVAGTPGASRPGFGGSLSISGKTAIIAAPGKESKPDHAFLYTSSGSGKWRRIKQLKGSNAGTNSISMVAVSGKTAAVGVPLVRGYGRIYLFTA